MLGPTQRVQPQTWNEFFALFELGPVLVLTMGAGEGTMPQLASCRWAGAAALFYLDSLLPDVMPAAGFSTYG